LGQNVNSYGSDLVEKNLLSSENGGPFVELLARVAQIPELARLRFTTSNPHDFTPELAALFKTQPKLGSYIHLPVQSGNNDVLDRMRRKVTREEYLERVKWLREIDPEMSLSTDLIVGFPGETDEQFADTLDLVERCQFSFIYSFKYSPRKNTAAARFTDQVPEEVKDQRLQSLNKLQDSITIAQHQNELGRRRSVLFHYESRKEPGVYYGRTQQFRLVRVKAGRDLVGHEMDVMITAGNKTALIGELVY
jgi:tRNA-2-methylthio-N6-dimethylallyladenosine synthase